MSEPVILKPGTYQGWGAYKMCCCLGPSLPRTTQSRGEGGRVADRHLHHIQIFVDDSKCAGQG